MKRIEFIDAMRGFAMLLVVFGHVGGFSYGDTEGMFSFNDVFGHIHMPIFFFISGFILYGSSLRWQAVRDCMRFVFKKARLLLVPPLVIGSVYTWLFGYDWVEGLFGAYKWGYWFTPVLLEFFCLYAVHYLLSSKVLHLSERQGDALLVAFAVFFFYFSQAGICRSLMGYDLYGLFSVGLMRHYLYFVFGYFARKHYSQLERLLDGRHSSAMVVASFFLIAIPFFVYKENLIGGGGVTRLFTAH